MTKETVDITNEIGKAEEDGVRIEYYTLDGKTPEIYMCPGDLIIICNVLYDYAKMLGEAAEISIGYEQGQYSYHIKRCERIRKKIETEMGYSTEQAIETCIKKHKYLGQEDLGQENDIGEDALVLAMRQRKQKKTKKDKGKEKPKAGKKPEKTKKEKQKPESGSGDQKEQAQMNIFEFLQEEGHDTGN